MNLPQLPADKANHALYGAIIFLVAGALAAAAGHPQQARLVGAGAAVLFGCAKELSDWLLNRRAVAAGLPPPHGVEAADVLATASGAFLCWAAAVATEG